MRARNIIESADRFGREFVSVPRHYTQAAVDRNDARMMRRIVPKSTGKGYAKRRRTFEPEMAGSAVCGVCGKRTEDIEYHKAKREWICNDCYDQSLGESIFVDNEFVRSTISRGYEDTPTKFKSEPQTISDFQAKLRALQGL